MTLHVEVSGSGPALLLIPGGAGDAATFGRLGPELCGERTIVAYDRRGFSRSGAPARERRFEVDVDDAARLIEMHGGGRADVFGSSSGAIVALGLAERFPGRVRRVVAHEPPLTAMVDDEAGLRAGFDDVVAVFRRSGAEAGMRRFGEVTGLGYREPPRAALPPAATEVLDRIAGNVPFWMEEELRQYTAIVPGPVAAGVVVAAGEAGEPFPARAARGLAARLGTAAVVFPGGHDGYAERPAEFAARLLEVLA
ncbi:alpha/beta fold hydrolase [Dactylosporangium sp. NPDC049140]|uniref:alpha/beta fold hydrolase n=1 Tax=Dactylosporangium sp. NPDC049140 TaxID=3155647 RepID=UPI0034089A38